MGLEEKPFVRSRQLEERREIFVVRRHDSAAQYNEVCAKGYILHNGRVMAGQGGPASFQLQNGLRRHLVPYEPYAEPPRFQVVAFQKAVGADVPVEDHHIACWGVLLQRYGVLHGSRTADPAAIRPLLIPRPDALYHNASLKGAKRAGSDLSFKLMLCHDPVVFAVAVMAVRLQLLAACGNDDDPVFYLPVFFFCACCDAR